MRILPTILSALLCLLTLSFATLAQHGGQLTTEESKATTELTNRFVQQLAETGDIRPLIKEVFVADFMKRYVAEELTELKANNSSKDRVLFTSGLEYDADLLVLANEDDWRGLYEGAFNFIHYGFAFMLNAQAKSIVSGKPAKPGEIEKLLAKMYPDDASKLMNENLFLRNMLRKGDDARPVKTLDEMRSLIKVFGDVNGLLSKTGKAKLTKDSQAALTLLNEKAGADLAPELDICQAECFGFPRGTRMIHVFATPMHALVITKVGSEFKVVSARHGSPD